METKPLLYGLIGFFLGGLLVSIAATTFDKPSERLAVNDSHQSTSTSMEDMTASLRDKTGDDYDKAFISYMIEHHQSAVDMAKSSANNAKHNEIKQLSNDIITAQQKEIQEMEHWQADWGYAASMNNRDTH
jgi:uncharacterized protein (DUF305 family)